MLKLSATFVDIPVMSLRNGQPLGVASQVIINPDNLKVEGWYVIDRFDNSKLALVTGDVRDILDQGIVVNDHDALTNPEDLVRLRDVMDLRFDLIGKLVVTASGKKIGKASDFAVETSSFFIKKIYVNQSIIKNFSGGILSIDRTQIVEITPSRIVVEDLVEKTGIKAVQPSPAT